MSSNNQKQISIGRPSTDSLLRLLARHFSSFVPATISKAAVQGKCHVCSHTLKREKSVRYTIHQCEDRHGGLSVIAFFQVYYTQKHF